MHYGWFQALSLGILCNILVCLAVWRAAVGKSVVDKMVGIIFPITTFVACGFEHSVANMFYLPYAYFLGLEAGIGEIFLNNLLPVTLGNVIGGAIFVGLVYWMLYHKGVEK